MARLSSLDKIGLVRSGMGDPATGDVPNSELAQFLWLAEMDIACDKDFPELRETEDLTTESGTADYEMTAEDILMILKPANDLTSGLPLTRMDDEWDREVGIYLGDGSPFYYFEQGVGTNGRKNIRLRPTPTDVRTIRIPYVKIPTAPDHEEANFSDLPQSFDLSVVSRAIEIGLQLTNERAEAMSQEKLSAKGSYRAGRTEPPKAYYVKRFKTFAERMRRR